MRMMLERRDDFSILHLKGEFDGLACPGFLKEIEQLIAVDDVSLVLDLSAVRAMNSTAMGACVKASKALRKRGGELVFSHPTAYCRHAIESLGLDKLIPVFDDESAAARHFTEGEPAPEAAHSKTVLEGKVTLLFTPLDEALNARLMELNDEVHRAAISAHRSERHWRGVGHMASVDIESLQFEWEPGALELSPQDALSLIRPGVKLNVTFGLSLLEKKRHHALVRVADVRERKGNLLIRATYEELEPETAEAVGRYVADLKYLRQELTRATGPSEAG